MNRSTLLGVLGMVATASIVSYLGMAQQAQFFWDANGRAINSTFSSSGFSSSTYSSATFSSVIADCFNSSTGTMGPCASSQASSTASTTNLIVGHTATDALQLSASGPVTYATNTTLQVAGPVAATNVRLVHPIPAGMTFLPNSSYALCSQQDTNIVCLIGNVSQGITVNVPLQYEATVPNPCTSKTFQSKVFGWTDTLESSFMDNAAGTQTNIMCPPLAKLSVAVKSIGMNNTIVKNQKNVNLLRFEARADSAASVLVSGASFTAQAGSLLNAQNYTLWVDTNGDAIVDTILEKGVPAMDGKVNLNNLMGGGYLIPANGVTTFEVHADVASSIVNNTLQLAFDTTSATYITANTDGIGGPAMTGISTNGMCPEASCQILVSTTPSTIFTIANQGSLFVTKDITPARSRQLLGGTLGAEVLRLTFRAEDEEINISTVNISTWDSVGASVDRLDFYLAGQTVSFATATVAGCGASPVLTQNPSNGSSIRTFCATIGNTTFVVPAGQQKTILVRPRLKTDESGAISGESLRFWLPKNANAIRAFGVVSTNTLIANDEDTQKEGEVFIGTNAATAGADIIGNANQAVLSKITSIVNANPDATNTDVPMGIRALGQFRFTAASNSNTKNGLNKVVLTNAIFTLNTFNVAFDKTSLKLYNKADATVKAPCTIIDDTGSSPYAVACWDIPASAVDSSISSGGSSTFALELSVTNPAVNPALASTLQVSLDRFNDVTQTGMAKTQSHIGWQDKDAVSTSTTFFWIEYPENAILSTKYVN